MNVVSSPNFLIRTSINLLKFDKYPSTYKNLFFLIMQFSIKDFFVSSKIDGSCKLLNLNQFLKVLLWGMIFSQFVNLSAQTIPDKNKEHAGAHVVILGTAGGRTSYLGSSSAGISSALVVDGSVYLVDFGSGWLRRFHQAGLGGGPPSRGLANLRAAFITHLHADHIVDYPSLFLFGSSDGLSDVRQPVQIVGPGSRGAIVPLKGLREQDVPLVNPENPTPGTVAMTNALLQAFATDINDNIRDSQKPDPRSLVKVRDIVIPAGLVKDFNLDPAPLMKPFQIYLDEKVRVTATLVNHEPVFPAFAFRFDTAYGSAVFSGDTSPSKNLIELASGADVLIHEVIDTAWVEKILPFPRSAAAQAKADHLIHAHTAVEDVGRVAQASGVKKLVLQHLAPADSSEVRWKRAQEGFNGQVIVGRDLLSVPLKNDR